MKEMTDRKKKAVTVMNVMEDFLFHCHYEKGLSMKTIKAYQVDIKQFEEFILENYSIECFEDITKDMIKCYLQKISGFMPKTIKRKIASMKALFSYYEYENDTYINPIRRIKIRIKEPKTLPVVMCDKDVKMILEYFYNKKNNLVDKSGYYYLARTRDVCIIELLFATGIRVAELCSLQCGDIDLINGSIKVNGKGSKERVIQICSKDVVSLLKEYRALAKPQSDFFVNRLRHGISTQSVRLLIKQCVKELELAKHITPHTFRHTFATLLLESDVDIKYIQTLLGHSSIVTTQIYTHVNLNKQKKILVQKHPRNKFMITSGKS